LEVRAAVRVALTTYLLHRGTHPVDASLALFTICVVRACAPGVGIRVAWVVRGVVRVVRGVVRVVRRVIRVRRTIGVVSRIHDWVVPRISDRIGITVRVVVHYA
jgi:hypothetical protein